jgi:gluconolactonase
MIADVVVEDTGLAEGPVYCPDGTLVIVSVDRGVLYRIDPYRLSKTLVADVSGGPNGAVLAEDGGFVITQNGGLDWDALEHVTQLSLLVGDEFPAYRPVDPGVQKISVSGEISYLTRDGFSAPNDLAVSGAGHLYFTDPPNLIHRSNNLKVGAIWSLSSDGVCSVVARDFSFCNGIAIDLDGSLIVVEQSGLQRVALDGEREWLIENLGPGGGDGLCLDVDGRIYVAASSDHCIVVVEDGKVVDELQLPPGGMMATNCCFGGTDRRTLFVTEGFPGRVLAFENMPVTGLELPTWPTSPEFA